MTYFVTNHVIDRIRERYPHLNVPKDIAQAWVVINDLMKNSSEEKSFLNNTGFMFHLEKEYGLDDKRQFFVNKEHDICFVVVNGNKVVTCHPIHDLLQPRKMKHEKKDKPFKTSQTKNKRIKSRSLSEYDAYLEYVSKNP